MSQNIWNSINPATTSGNQLAQLLDDFKEAMVSGMSGTTRPTELDASGIWVDTTNDGIGFWDVKIWTGVQDIVIANINKSTGVATIPGADSSFNITKISDDSIGPHLNLQKKRIAGGGQTLTSDVIGKVHFKGYDAVGTAHIQAYIEGVTTEDVSGTNKGSRLKVFTTKTGTGSPTEVAIFTNDAKFGVGTSTPAKKIHSKATDSSAGIGADRIDDTADPVGVDLRKERLSGTGQTLNGDTVSKVSSWGKDQLGGYAELAKVEVHTLEDTSDVAHGSKMTFHVKGVGEVAFTEVMEVSKTGVKVLGLPVAGNYTTYANEAIANGGTISKVDNIGFQYRRVSGNGGAIALSTTPFGSMATVNDGTVFTIMCTDDVNTVEITHNDIQYGAILNGDKILKKYESVTLMYDAVLERLIEI